MCFLPLFVAPPRWTEPLTFAYITYATGRPRVSPSQGEMRHNYSHTHSHRDNLELHACVWFVGKTWRKPLCEQGEQSHHIDQNGATNTSNINDIIILTNLI